MQPVLRQQPAMNVSGAQFNSDQHGSSVDATLTNYLHVELDNVSKTVCLFTFGVFLIA